MKIYSYDDSPRTKRMSELLEKGLPEWVETVRLFPIPTTRDGKTVCFAGVPIWDCLKELGDGELVVGYGIPEDIRTSLFRAGIRVADAALDEKFLVDNAELTALGTLGHILLEGGVAVSDLSIGIVGYGRIGSALVRLLLPLSAELTVYTGRESVRAELGGYGIRSESETDFAGIEELDILINTAPAPLLAGVQKPHGLRVIDLASGDYLCAWSGVEKYPSLPSRLYPESSAKIWYQSVLRSI